MLLQVPRVLFFHMLQKPFLLFHIPHIHPCWTLLQGCANTGWKGLSNALPSLLPGPGMLPSWSSRCQLPSQQALDKDNLLVSLLLFLAPGTHWQEPVELDRFPGLEQPCRSPLLLARRRDRGGGFTNSSGIRLPKQSCGAQDDAQEHQPTTKRLCKPGARLS